MDISRGILYQLTFENDIESDDFLKKLSAKINGSLPIRNIAITKLAVVTGCSVLMTGCLAPSTEWHDPQPIIDNLVKVGFASNDIQVANGVVYVGRDAEVSLAASREMLQSAPTGKEQYRTANLVSSSLTKICIDGSTFTGVFSSALDLAIENYQQQALTFQMARTPSTGCGFTINAVLQPGVVGGVSGFPSGGLPFRP